MHEISLQTIELHKDSFHVFARKIEDYMACCSELDREESKETMSGLLDLDGSLYLCLKRDGRIVLLHFISPDSWVPRYFV